MGTDKVDEEDGFHTPFANPIKEAQWIRRRNLAEMLSRAGRRYHSTRSTAVGTLVTAIGLLLFGLWTFWYWGEVGAGTLNGLVLGTISGAISLYSWGAANARKEEVNKIADDVCGAYYHVSWFISKFDGMQSAKLEDQVPWPD